MHPRREGGRKGGRGETYHLGKHIFVGGGGAEAGALGHDLAQDLEDLVIRVAHDGRALCVGEGEGGKEGGREGGVRRGRLAPDSSGGRSRKGGMERQGSDGTEREDGKRERGENESRKGERGEGGRA